MQVGTVYKTILQLWTFLIHNILDGNEFHEIMIGFVQVVFFGVVFI